MPKPNRPRTIASEDNLARRIAYERERYGWSYAGLADRMTKAGCAIDASALYKIEKNTPRRRISVDELVALSEVLALPVAELLMPPELHAKKQALAVLEQYRQARAAYYAALSDLAAVSDADPLVNDALNELLVADDIPMAEIHYGVFKIGQRWRYVTAAEFFAAGRGDLTWDELAALRDQREAAERKRDEEGAPGGEHREEA